MLNHFKRRYLRRVAPRCPHCRRKCHVTREKVRGLSYAGEVLILKCPQTGAIVQRKLIYHPSPK